MTQSRRTTCRSRVQCVCAGLVARVACEANVNEVGESETAAVPAAKASPPPSASATPQPKRLAAAAGRVGACLALLLRDEAQAAGADSRPRQIRRGAVSVFTSVGVEQARQYRSGDPLFVVDEELRIVAWNAAVEALTGVPADAAVGNACWSVVGGLAEDGAVVCHAGCALAREAFKRRVASSQSLVVRTSSGRRRVTVSTISAGAAGSPHLVHLLRAVAPTRAVPPAPEVQELTPRQREVLGLLGAGEDARQIAATLEISVATVRTHIRHILRTLGVHTQLAAVVRACRPR